MVHHRRAGRTGRGSVAVVLVASLGLALPSSALVFIPTAPAAPPETAVRLHVDGAERALETRAATVADALAEARIEVGPKDEVIPPPESPLVGDLTIQVVRITREKVTVDEEIPFDTQFKRLSRRASRLPTIATPGKPGVERRTYEVIRRDGVEVGRRPLRTLIVKAPVDQIVTVRGRGALPSRGYYGGRRVFKMVATAYDPSPASCGPYADGFTAIGLRAGFGVVAVDPNVIPMGTKLFIEGYGEAIAGDIGGAIKGNRIDLGFDTRREALRFGRPTVTVWVRE